MMDFFSGQMAWFGTALLFLTDDRDLSVVYPGLMALHSMAMYFNSPWKQMSMPRRKRLTHVILKDLPLNTQLNLRKRGHVPHPHKRTVEVKLKVNSLTLA